MEMRTAEPIRLYDAISKALEEEAASCRFGCRDDLQHTFELKAVHLNPKELRRILAQLDAFQAVRTHISATLIHHWAGTSAGREELDYHHPVRISRHEGPEEPQFRVEPDVACHWELIPEGSPGALDEWYWNPTRDYGERAIFGWEDSDA